MDHLVNRFDVWGQYTVKNTVVGPKVSAVTLPVKDLREQKKDFVSHEKLIRHFKGLKAGHLIGLHLVSIEETCRWFAIDLDVHDPEDFHEKSRLNFAAATRWFQKMRADELDPCIIDSNGFGGLHLICLLDRPYPVADVHRYLVEIVSDYKEIGLAQSPELFPSSDRVEGLGKWLRMPGRHHTHQHFSKVWSDDDPDEPWLEGISAIEHLLSLRPMPLPATQKSKRPRAKPKTRHRSAVCVDLDSVIARYDGWRGMEKIGEPISGSREFLTEIRKKYRVIVYTSRINAESVRGDEVARLKNHIERWLNENALPFDEVYTGFGKPLALAFVDDRAVSCRPQEDAEAFENALKAIGEL
ncbi:MAG: hypothetical protein IPJ30_18665 [Acidobacteria bacterium]|nr:hypothetical protein [Acidobacteriota bacterium]